MNKMVSSAYVKVLNSRGLHAQIAASFARESRKYISDIEVINDVDMKANGKDIGSLLLLMADKGSYLTIVAKGADSCEAIKELSKIFLEIHA